MRRREFLLQGPTIFLPALFSGEPNVCLAGSPEYWPFLIFDGRPADDLPTLQQMTAGAVDEAATLNLIVSYFDAQQPRLAALWRENHPQRLAALFAMELIHISHPYGASAWRPDLLDYINQPAAQCATQSFAQAKLCTALGLTWRRVSVATGFHGWIECLIDNLWEIFDGTSSVWVSRGGLELMDGGARRYRLFYSPWCDESRPEARQVLAGYDPLKSYNATPGTLRSNLPGLGVYWLPGALQVDYQS